MTSRPDVPSRKPRWLGLAAVLTVVAVFAAWDAVVRSRHLLEVSGSYGVAVDPPREDAESPTGYEQGKRSLLLPAADSAHWVMQTQAMMASGHWRLRHVSYDNAPEGRAVHWAAPFHWWLAGLAWVDHLVSGRPVGLSVERATLAAGPVMLGLLLAGLMPLLCRKFSPVAAALTALGVVAVHSFYTDFQPGRADHHGLANICCLLTVLLMAGGMAAPARRAARRWFAGSALAGGAGLWISAATQVPVLIGLGLGVLAGAWAGRRADHRPVWLDDPGLFRLWGWTGGGASFAAYLLEYFPSHLGLRLEVNHPLYAVAWIGAGEMLRVAVLVLRDGWRPLPRRDHMGGGVAVLLVALLPAILAATAAKTFTVADPFVWQLHSVYISEFGGLGRFVTLDGHSLTLCLPLLLLVPPLWLAWRRTTPPGARAQLALVLLPAVLGAAMGLNQVRWLGLAHALSVPVLAVFFQVLESPGGATRRALAAWAVALALLLLPGAVDAVQRTRASAEFTAGEMQALAQRDVAHWLRQRGGGDRVVVAGTPTPTTNLIALGGLNGLGTLYWENAEGLKKAAALFAAPSPDAAREIAARCGVTHIALFSWDSFEVFLAKLSRGVPAEAPYPPDMFVVRLLSEAVPPPWLRAVPFQLPENAALKDARVRIWEVIPEQTEAAATARAANYYFELGLPAFAARYVPLLEAFKDDLSANVLLAGLTSWQQDADAFAPAFRRVLAQLPQADVLALDEHLHLVVVLVVGQQQQLARAQLQSAMRKLDERSLRRLTMGELNDLLELTGALGVGWPDPALSQLARGLVPPNRRQ